MLLAAGLAAPFGGAAQAAPPAAAEARPSPALQRLHEALGLSAAQESAWRAFAAAAGPDPAQIARHRQAADMVASLPAPRRADLMVAVMRADLEAAQRRAAAITAFYGVLTPAQQAIFDRQTAPPRDGER
ncbi:MAG TPA: Spy/CpxP family protein refolding chaperone [Caulobacteraceae bacterium]|nr:Spy/CpxP family protein refolding chaperone [Caulobacteraceae bacterium]